VPQSRYVPRKVRVFLDFMAKEMVSTA
jgi:hypothetical protein